MGFAHQSSSSTDFTDFRRFLTGNCQLTTANYPARRLSLVTCRFLPVACHFCSLFRHGFPREKNLTPSRCPSQPSPMGQHKSEPAGLFGHHLVTLQTQSALIDERSVVTVAIEEMNLVTINFGFN